METRTHWPAGTADRAQVVRVLPVSCRRSPVRLRAKSASSARRRGISKAGEPRRPTPVRGPAVERDHGLAADEDVVPQPRPAGTGRAFPRKHRLPIARGATRNAVLETRRWPGRRRRTSIVPGPTVIGYGLPCRSAAPTFDPVCPASAMPYPSRAQVAHDVGTVAEQQDQERHVGEAVDHPLAGVGQAVQRVDPARDQDPGQHPRQGARDDQPRAERPPGRPPRHHDRPQVEGRVAQPARPGRTASPNAGHRCPAATTAVTSTERDDQEQRGSMSPWRTRRRRGECAPGAAGAGWSAGRAGDRASAPAGMTCPACSDEAWASRAPSPTTVSGSISEPSPITAPHRCAPVRAGRAGPHLVPGERHAVGGRRRARRSRAGRCRRARCARGSPRRGRCVRRGPGGRARRAARRRRRAGRRAPAWRPSRTGRSPGSTAGAARAATGR